MERKSGPRSLNKMKSFQQVLLLLFVIGLTAFTVKANFKLHHKFLNATKYSKGNLFVRSIEYLHRRPPFFEQTTNRAAMTIEQKLDHFDDSNTKTWQMRYYMNDTFYEEGGPIFIDVNGEWTMTSQYIVRSHFVDIAAEHKGILFSTEHRYYGGSRPTSDITTENLKYLHVKQALADLAHFIKYQRQNIPGLANSKVIMEGGSYSATMVVWFKRLYPELLAGGFASSAPLIAKVDFREYEEVSGRAILELGGQRCYDRIEKGVAKLEAMLEQGRAAEVKAMLRLCDTFDEKNDLDLWSLFSTISKLFSGIIQYQEGNDIARLCDYLLEQKDDATAIAKFFIRYASPLCEDVSYKATLEYYRDSTYVHGSSRPWFYQTCNEYGWYQTSGSRKQPFGSTFPVTLQTVMCEDIFGSQYKNSSIYAKVAQTNVDFGGLSPNVENIYETHGALDPWNAVGHTAEDGATILPLRSHCSDFASISGQDSAELRASKEKLAELMRQWLAN